MANAAPVPNAPIDATWLRSIPRRGPMRSTNTPAGIIVNRVASVHARNRMPTAAAEPVSLRIVHERAV